MMNPIELLSEEPAHTSDKMQIGVRDKDHMIAIGIYQHDRQRISTFAISIEQAAVVEQWLAMARKKLGKS